MSLAVLCLVLADITVPTGGSIQAAIQQAQNGDRVLVSPGTYAEYVSFLGKAIEVIGVAGADATVIDGATLSPGDPLVRFHQQEGPGSVLQGFTVRGGKTVTINSGSASAISCLVLGSPGTASATPLIRDCVIRNNQSQFTSPGVGGNAILERCVLRNNSSSYLGGALYGAPLVRNCVIADNVALEGGGLCAIGGTATVIDSVFARNRAVDSAHGGAIYVGSWGPSGQGNLAMTGSLLVDNRCDGYGYLGRGAGVFFATTNVQSVIDRCTIVGGSCALSMTGYPGTGGIDAQGGPAWMSVALSLRNSIVQGNVGDDDYSAITSIEYTNVQGGAAGPGCIDVPPAWVDAAGGDYHLLPSDLGIDAGSPSSFDPDGTPADLGAFPFERLYTRSNVTLAQVGAQPSLNEIDATVGGKQVLRIAAGAAHAGKVYVVAGSFAGTSPGIVVQGQAIPLNPDFYLNYTLSFPNSFPISASVGFLDGNGRADCTFALPPAIAAPFAPATLHHAAGVIATGGALVLATDAERLTLVP